MNKLRDRFLRAVAYSFQYPQSLLWGFLQPHFVKGDLGDFLKNNFFT